MDYLKNTNFWMLGFFFFYFFIMGAEFPFFPIWLHDINPISKGEALGFTLISAFTLSGPGPLSVLRRRASEAL